MLKLSSGFSIPLLGFGSGTAWFKGARGDDALAAAVTEALRAGYRHIDEAEMYENEGATGRGIRAFLSSPPAGVSRSDLFITSKVLTGIDAPGGVAAACRRTLANLGLDYLDLYLLHAPFRRDGTSFAVPLPALWREMEALVSDGLVRSIGVSNFRRCDLAAISAGARIGPAVNQVERHLCLRQPALARACADAGVALAAYGPLVPLTRAGAPAVAAAAAGIAAARGVTPHQVLLAWSLAAGVITLTTSSDPARMRQSLAALDLRLSADELAALDSAGEQSPPMRAFWTHLPASVDWDA